MNPINNPYYEFCSNHLHPELFGGGYTVGSFRFSIEELKEVSWFKKRREFSFGIPSPDVLSEIVAISMPLVELGAGNGYWAYCLRQLGVDVLAFDIFPPVKNHKNRFFEGIVKLWTAIEAGDETCLTGTVAQDRALFLCWPPYEDEFAFNALRNYVQLGGSCLVYVGESEGGCCATDNFFTEMRNLEQIGWNSAQHRMLNWCGVHDEMIIARKNNLKGRHLRI